MEAFMEFHLGLPRQGPGSAETTRRAYEALRGCGLPSAPRVLDVGCGPGAQTLGLARLGGGPIVAVDFHAPFLEELRIRAAGSGLLDRIELRCADMNRLDFAPGSFDLIWSEGAIYVMGFEKGLRTWRPMLRERGFVAVTEATWLRPDPPEDLRRFWAESYPAMNDVGRNLNAVRAAGYEVLGHFTLPESCWWEYYGPIEAKLDTWLARHPGDNAAATMVDLERREIDLYRRYSSWYGYVFYLMRRW